jgi:hypothetical protein
MSLVLVLVPTVAHAHQPSTAHLRISVDDTRLSGRLDIALRDLELVVGLDADHDGDVRFAEVRAAAPAIAAYVQAHLAFAADGAACVFTATPPAALARHVDGAHAVIPFAATCPATPRALTVDYRVLVDADALHRGLLALSHAGRSQTAVLAGPATLTLATPSGTFAAFVREGVWHIWIGLDHVLFLLALLLPAVLARDSLRRVLTDVFEVVTAFTLAHSITLILAALGVVRLPSRFVEAAIAASVALAALNNLLRVVDARWAVAFALGLLHGFGFSSVLLDLGLPAGTLVPALLGFNLGVELGQAAIVAAFLPLAFLVRRTVAYRVVLYAGSAAIVAIALRWSVERLAA